MELVWIALSTALEIAFGIAAILIACGKWTVLAVARKARQTEEENTCRAARRRDERKAKNSDDEKEKKKCFRFCFTKAALSIVGITLASLLQVLLLLLFWFWFWVGEGHGYGYGYTSAVWFCVAWGGVGLGIVYRYVRGRR